MAKISQQTIDRFEAWCSGADPATATVTEEDLRPLAHDGAIKEHITAAMARPGEVLRIQRLPLRFADLLSQQPGKSFASIHIDGTGSSELALRGVKAWALRATGMSRLCLEDCEIGHLSTDGRPRYDIQRCMIGHFHAGAGNPVQRLEWSGGYLGQFHLHEDIKRCFVGDVWLRDVQLPLDPKHHDVQWLRDAREALNARSNFVAAGIFHASELTLSRRREPFTNRLASVVYQCGSSYGNSIKRPVVWFFCFLLAIFLIAVGAGTTASPEATQGWHISLQQCDYWAKALRAGVYAFQSIFNPLNLIVPKPLVSVSHWWAALAGAVLGVLGVVAFALFLLSVRRRFKLD